MIPSINVLALEDDIQFKYTFKKDLNNIYLVDESGRKCFI